MIVFKKLLIRLFIVGIPLAVLYFGFLFASELNRQKQHPSDVGLGFAILLLFVFLVLSVGFIVDFIKSIQQKQYKTAIVDIPFLVLFVIPILYIHCQMGGSCESFCNWYINLFHQ